MPEDAGTRSRLWCCERVAAVGCEWGKFGMLAHHSRLIDIGYGSGERWKQDDLQVPDIERAPGTSPYAIVIRATSNFDLRKEEGGTA